MGTAPAAGFVIALCAINRAIPIPQPRSAPLNPNAHVSDPSEPGPTPPQLSDLQVLRVLEVRQPAKSESPAPVARPTSTRIR
jgi:hypothetical protein